MRRAVLALAALCVLVAPAAAAAGGPVTGRLVRSGRWVTDPQGRVVVMHGFNLVKKLAPFYPRNFTTRDARLLADEGFTVARVGIIWEALEPSPGRYDDRYLGHVLALERLLGRYGIRTLVDFHQDGWSRGFGFDGAPKWADATRGVLDSFAAFWRNTSAVGGVGVQTRFAAAWEHVARALRSHADVLGLDPFNEPYPGSAYGSPCGPFSPCPGFESGALASFYRRVIAAIRAGGARQVIWPEGIAQNGQLEPSLPRFADRQTAFTFHYYCGATQTAAAEVAIGRPSPETRACAPEERRGIGTFLAYAKRIGAPSLLGEWSCNDVDPDNAQVVDLTGRTFTSWTIWAYARNAPDPVDCAGQGLLRDERRPASEVNAKQHKLDALVVPHAQAVAGTPLASSYDRLARTFTLSYRAHAVHGATLAPGAQTQVFIPARVYPHGYRVRVAGARVTSPAASPWLELAARRGAGNVTVRVAPRTGASTTRPLRTGALPFPCTSAATTVVRLGVARPALVAQVTVAVNGRVVRVLRGPRARVRVTLASRRVGASDVELTIRTAAGRERVVRRTILACS